MKILFRGCVAVCRRVGLEKRVPEEITRPSPFALFLPLPSLQGSYSLHLASSGVIGITYA